MAISLNAFHPPASPTSLTKHSPAPTAPLIPALDAISVSGNGTQQKLFNSETIAQIKDIDLKKYRDLPAKFNSLERLLWIIPVIGWIALIIIHVKRKKCRLQANAMVDKDISSIDKAVSMSDSTLKWRYVYERGRQYLLAGKGKEALDDFNSITIEDELCSGYDFPMDFLYLKANACRLSGDLWEAYETYQSAIEQRTVNPGNQKLVQQIDRELGEIDTTELLLKHFRKISADAKSDGSKHYATESSSIQIQWTPDVHLKSLVGAAQTETPERKIAIIKVLFGLNLPTPWCFEQAYLLINRFITEFTIEQKLEIALIIPNYDKAIALLKNAFEDSAPLSSQRGQIAFKIGEQYKKKAQDSAKFMAIVQFTSEDGKNLISFFEEAVKLGIEDGRKELAYIYDSGLWVPPDPAKSYYWSEIYGKQPSRHDLVRLAEKYELNYDLYEKSKGTYDNLKEALAAYKKALTVKANIPSTKIKEAIERIKSVLTLAGISSIAPKPAK